MPRLRRRQPARQQVLPSVRRPAGDRLRGDEPASAKQLLGALLGDDPSVIALRPGLIARTEGNPFFLEESVRSLVETRARLFTVFNVRRPE